MGTQRSNMFRYGSTLMMLISMANYCTANSPDTYVYFRMNNFDSQTPLSTQPVCMDKCDVSGLCSNGQTCAQLTKKYSCGKYYQEGQSYAGWCDMTCGVCTQQPKLVQPIPEAAVSTTEARRVSWNMSYQLFDSPRPVNVVRYDVLKSSTDLRLGTLSLTDGAAYIFTTSPLLVMRDVVTNKKYTIYSESVAWAAKGSCLELDLGRSTAAGNVSVIVVSSGETSLDTKAAGTCKAAVVKVASGMEGELHNNPVDYVANGTCSDALDGPGGANDYDDLDMPIGPLRAHYHTRGALYYTASGSSFYNDADGAGGIYPNSIQAGELRFVQVGVYYGPETMWDSAYVMSFHEPDPSARSTQNITTPTGFNPCSFACCDKLAVGATPMTCLAPKYDS